jgi:hypothetical protein
MMVMVNDGRAPQTAERIVDVIASKIPRAMIPVPEVARDLGLPPHALIDLVCEAENQGVIRTWELDGQWYCCLSETEAQQRKIELESSVTEKINPKQYRWVARAWIPLREDKKEAQHRKEAKRKKRAESKGEAGSSQEAESRGRAPAAPAPILIDYRDAASWKSVGRRPGASPLLVRDTPSYSTGWKLVGLCRPGWMLDCEPTQDELARRRRRGGTCGVCGDRPLASGEYCLGCCADAGDRPQEGVQKGGSFGFEDGFKFEPPASII